MKHISIQLLQAALEVQGFFEQKNWQFAFIGGLALFRWGQQRTTKDVDGTLLTMFSDEEKYVDAILSRFKSRITGAREFALRNRVLLLTASNGIGIDFSLAGLPFEQQAVDRSTLYEYTKGCKLRTCSAEDLLVFKAFAARDQDWADVWGILERQKGKLDLDYVRQNLAPLVELKEAPEIMLRLEEMISSL
ncbi:MAG: nucleotidyltransferase [Planctomycetaceae bacterium]|nr:nucleotidyltransferase [Planctomycetaceae bacterium]